MKFSAPTKGFTLIELLIVVVVIGIIAALVLVRFGDAKEKAYKDAMLSDLRNYAMSQELHRATHDSYAADAGALGFHFSPDVRPDSSDGDGLGWLLRVAHEKTDITCALRGGSLAAYGGERSVCSDGTTEPGTGSPGEGDEGPDDGDEGPGSGDDEEDEDEGDDGSSESPAAFSWSPEPPNVYEVVSFSAENRDAATSFNWRFENLYYGGVSGETAEHTFTQSGLRSVWLIATTPTGVDTVRKQVRVNARPDASFMFSPGAPEPGDTITFDASASSDAEGIDRWEWDFSTHTASGEIVKTVFDTAGTYNVTLAVYDGDRGVDTKVQSVTVASLSLMTGIVTNGLLGAYDPADLTQGEGYLTNLAGGSTFCALGLGTNYIPPRFSDEGFIRFGSDSGTVLNQAVSCSLQGSGWDLRNPTFFFVLRPRTSQNRFLMDINGQRRMSFSGLKPYVQEQSSGVRFWNAEEQYTSDEWVTHAVSAQAGSPPTFYRNGAPLTVLSGDAWRQNTSTGSRMLIGNRDTPHSNYAFIGDVGPFLIYDRALTQAEIQQNHDAVCTYGQAKGFAWAEMCS